MDLSITGLIIFFIAAGLIALVIAIAVNDAKKSNKNGDNNITKKSKIAKNEKTYTNETAKAIYILAMGFFIVFVGISVFNLFFYLSQSSNQDYAVDIIFGAGFVFLLYGFLTVLILGFAEIIELLQQIKDKK